jgi:RNA polymerase sigma factor (sigma-70 family)
LSDDSPLHAEPTDESLMAQLAAGNHEAIVPLLVRYAPRIQRLAKAAVDSAVAEDIVQDVFVAVWRGADSFDPKRGALRDWLLRIARNRISNELRRRGRHPETSTAADETVWSGVSDSGPQPSEAVWHEFRRRVLRAAVDALPSKQRQAIALAFFDDLTHEQVAAALDVPLGTAKTRIRSAIGILRNRLAPILASLIVLVVVAGIVWHDLGKTRRLEQEDRALWLVTSSDVVPLRLEAASGIDAKTHGTYRGRAGEGLAVLTFSNFSPAPSGQEYRAWARVKGHWLDLGNVRLNDAGNGRLVAENQALAEPPEEVRVTLEPTSGSSSSEPSGSPVISWMSKS